MGEVHEEMRLISKTKGEKEAGLSTELSLHNGNTTISHKTQKTDQVSLFLPLSLTFTIITVVTGPLL